MLPRKGFSLRPSNSNPLQPLGLFFDSNHSSFRKLFLLTTASECAIIDFLRTSQLDWLNSRGRFVGKPWLFDNRKNRTVYSCLALSLLVAGASAIDVCLFSSPS